MRKVLVKVGGETLQKQEDRDRLAADLAGVHERGVHLCVVHGAGPQITAMGKRLGIDSVFRGGRRVTDAAMLQAVTLAMGGEVAPALLAACLGAGLPAVAFPAASGLLVVGRKRPPREVAGEAEPVDFGLVADVVHADGRLLQTLWQGDYVPVLSSLVCDPCGQLLNLNADTLVTALVKAAKIDDVVLVTGVPGVFRELADPASHIAELSADEIPQLISSGAVHGGMVAKLEEVAEILRLGAKQVAIVGYKDDDAVAAYIDGAAGLRTIVHA